MNGCQKRVNGEKCGEPIHVHRDVEATGSRLYYCAGHDPLLDRSVSWAFVAPAPEVAAE